MAFTLLLTQAHAETVVLDLSQSIERAMKSDPRITEKEKLVDAARALLSEAQGADGWIFGANSFVGLAPKLRGGFFETTGSSGQQGVGIPDDAFDFNGISPWYFVDFSIIKPLNTCCVFRTEIYQYLICCGAITWAGNA